jgi:hypothetical protein
MQAAFDAIDASVAKFAAQMDETTRYIRLGQWNEQARRYREAVDLLSCHYYPTMNEQTAFQLLGRYGIRPASLGDVSLSEMINDARRLLGRPESC